MKKILSLLFLLVILYGCDSKEEPIINEQPPHQHSYSILKYDESSHWNECECLEFDTKVAHDYQDGVLTEPTNLSDGFISYKCKVCNYTKKETVAKIKGRLVDSYPHLVNADAVYYDGSIYTYGGSTHEKSDAIYRYSVSTDKLYELDVKLDTALTSPRAVLVGSKVYILGGLDADGVASSKVMVHDLENQTIKTLTSELPVGMNSFQVGYYNSNIYIIGNSLNEIYSFDVETSLTSKLDVETIAGGKFNVSDAAWCTVDKYIYILGGKAETQLNSIYRFDMQTKELVKMNATLPMKASGLRAVYDGDNTIYLYGGKISDSLSINLIMTFDIQLDKTSYLSCIIPTAVANACVVKTDVGNYILGGNTKYSNIIYKHINDEVISIRTVHEHKYTTTLYDDEHHWSRCECSAVTANHKHEFAEGVVKTLPTDQSTGVKTYACKDCNYVKETEIPAIAGVLVDEYPQVSNAEGVYYEGFIYTYGGNTSGRVKSIYRYDVKNDKLYLLDAELEVAITSHRVVLRDNKAYIFGGTGSPRNYKVLVHDLDAQTISPLKNAQGEEVVFPVGLNCFQLGVYGEYAYFVGGLGTEGNLTKVYQFSFETYDLQVLDNVNMPQFVAKAGWANVGKYLYIFGGTGVPRLNTIYRFDMETYAIDELGSLPEGVYLGQSRAVYDGNGNIYVYGGTKANDETVGTIIKYNIENNTAELLENSLPIGVANANVQITEYGVFIMGGSYDYKKYYNNYKDLIIKHDLTTGVVELVRTPILIEK